METWKGREKIEVLVKFVEGELERLSNEKRKTYRVRRQISDGNKFLDMLKQNVYSRATTIDELKRTISQRRKKIQNVILDMEKFLPGHQLNMFEPTVDINKEDSEIIENEKNNLMAELKWLHKCLGICHNKEYFR